MMTFHAPHCRHLGDSHEALPVDEARQKYPNHNFDLCAAGVVTPYVTVETAVAEHDYEPSGERPDDAMRDLCRKCFGTHGEGERETITVRTEAPQQSARRSVILPHGVRIDSQDRQ